MWSGVIGIHFGATRAGHLAVTMLIMNSSSYQINFVLNVRPYAESCQCDCKII